MTGSEHSARAAAIVLSCVLLGGCSTTGIRDIDNIRHGTVPEKNHLFGGHSSDNVCNAASTTALVDARNCVQYVATALSETQLGFYDQAYGWNYAFTTVAGSVVGATIFGAAPDAVKALALGGGSLAALNSVQPPIALSAAYGSGAVALQCVVDASNQIPDDWNGNKKNIITYKTAGDNDLGRANSDLAGNANDAEVPTLKAAIDAYIKAQQLYTSVIPFLSNPPALLIAQIDTVRMRMIQKLAPNSTSAAGQETAINNYIAAMQNSAAATTAKSDSVGVSQTLAAKRAAFQAMSDTIKQTRLQMLQTGKVKAYNDAKPFLDAAQPQPSQLLTDATRLNIAAQDILSVGQGYSNIQTQITGCIAKMP